MSTSEDDRRVGLCARCAEAKIVESNKGSRFYLCGRAARDPRFRKYPELPVLKCDGFVEAPDG